MHKLEKSHVYYKILSTILSRYVNTQHTGLILILKYSNNLTYQVHLVFPLALCMLDMKGGHQLYGMYNKYVCVKRACISCYCSEDNLNNTNEQCIHVLHHNMPS